MQEKLKDCTIKWWFDWENSCFYVSSKFWWVQMSPVLNQKEEPRVSVEKKRPAADEETLIPREALKVGEQTAVSSESLTETEPEAGDGSRVEYTELALDCLDLKAQEELLSPPKSGDHSILVRGLTSKESSWIHDMPYLFYSPLSWCVVKQCDVFVQV